MTIIHVLREQKVPIANYQRHRRKCICVSGVKYKETDLWKLAGSLVQLNEYWGTNVR